jgi:methylenetetrahydrofolate reductase (NADPH)
MKTSFEFFPPQSEQGKKNLQLARNHISKINPEYFSVTYGAGGTTQESTFDTVIDIKTNEETPVAPHLTCVGASKITTKSILDKYKANGINKLVALRGDIPSGMQNRGELRYANELVEFIKSEYNDYFHIRVAAYTESHPQSKNISSELNNFAKKVSAGADGAITQYFYNPDAYYRFVDDIAKLGVDIPITPGIMPITNYENIVRFSNMCNTQIPKWITERLRMYRDDNESLLAFGEDVVLKLCQNLKDNGVDSLHFYTMNRSVPVMNILNKL